MRGRAQQKAREAIPAVLKRWRASLESATGGERWLNDNGQWDLVAGPGLLGRVPEVTKKYLFVGVDGKTVAGRQTKIWERLGVSPGPMALNGPVIASAWMWGWPDQSKLSTELRR